MSDKKTITFALMDPPYENARSTTALRLINYEGAVGLPFTKQSPHPNAVHGHDADEEDHPLPHEWIDAIAKTADANGGTLDWINCGLCVDERGVHEALDFVRRGSPADLWKWAESSDNTLIIPTK
jgi:tRNA 2-thiouridine synthesizing protein D